MSTRLSTSLALAALTATSLLIAPRASAQPVFVNEIHYDNTGTDEGEAIEIAGVPGTDLSGWRVVLYNGANGMQYDSVTLSEILPESCTDPTAGVTVIAFPTNGIQNGPADGIALVDPSGEVVEFLSYEGTLTAIGGPADGTLSTDIGASESSSTAIGDSLQRSLDGWAAGPADFGDCNPEQIEPPLEGGGGGEPTAAKIHEIQGAGSEITGAGPFEVEAIVVGDFQRNDQLQAFFLQEEDVDADGDPATSEGILVFCGGCVVDVEVGDKVRVVGTASEFFGMSQLADITEVVVVSSAEPLPTPVTIDLPVPTSATNLEEATADIDAFYEPYEGMLVQFTDLLTVDEYFQLGRFGQLVLSEGPRPRQFTDVSAPDENGFTLHQIDLATRRVTLDDDNNIQNSALTNDIPVFHPQPGGFSIDNFFRGGETIESLTGVLHWSWAGFRGTDAWRLRPVVEALDYTYGGENPRTNAPEEVGGSLKVASFNVLNYFTTLDEGVSICGPSQDLGCRGANSVVELERQTDKIVRAICAIDVDIVGLVELENEGDPNFDPLEALTAALFETGCGEYAFIDTGATGTDAIRVGVIYKPAAVEPIGVTAVQDDPSFTDPENTGEQKNRPAIAQAFVELESGESLVIVVNHLKSKGSPCGEGDDSPETGVASCNLTRKGAAEAQVDWLAGDPTETGTENVLVIGDLNAYRKEEPIQVYIDAGYTDLIDTSNGESAYSFVFDGQLGYLDYGLANEALLPKVTGITEWHINADEVNLLDYNDTVRDAGEASFEAKPSALPLYDADVYRSSDHDPLVIGLQLASPVPACDGQEATIYVNEEGVVVGGPKDGQDYRGVLFGSDRADVIVGTDERDYIVAGKGNDVVCALGARDVVVAGSGDDYVEGGEGKDTILGGFGNDTLLGGPGNDWIFGGFGRDRADGGEGRDACFWASTKVNCE